MESSSVVLRASRWSDGGQAVPTKRGSRRGAEFAEEGEHGSSAPKGHNKSAQGNALGGETEYHLEALKGRRSGGSFVRPFRATVSSAVDYPGRCPGLICGCPFGATEIGPHRNMHARDRLVRFGWGSSLARFEDADFGDREAVKLRSPGSARAQPQSAAWVADVAVVADPEGVAHRTAFGTPSGYDGLGVGHPGV